MKGDKEMTEEGKVQISKWKCRGCKCGKTDCFAHTGRVCSLLVETYPNDDSCPFYKTKKQYERDRERWDGIAGKGAKNVK